MVEINANPDRGTIGVGWDVDPRNFYQPLCKEYVDRETLRKCTSHLKNYPWRTENCAYQRSRL